MSLLLNPPAAAVGIAVSCTSCKLCSFWQPRKRAFIVCANTATVWSNYAFALSTSEQYCR
jgi:hypothetical protein